MGAGTHRAAVSTGGTGAVGAVASEKGQQVGNVDSAVGVDVRSWVRRAVGCQQLQQVVNRYGAVAGDVSAVAGLHLTA